MIAIGAVLLFLQLSPLLSAWDWPLDAPIVSSSFLSIDNGRRSPRLRLDSRSSTTVYASEAGQVLLASEYVSQPSRVRPAHVLGGMVIIANRDQFRTLYSDVRPTVSGDDVVLSGEAIAQIDRQRRENGIYISVLDRTQQMLLNPQLLFPRLPDNIRPNIFSFQTFFKQSNVIGDYFNVHIGTVDRRRVGGAEPPILPPFVSVSYQSQRHTIFLDSVRSDGRYLYNTASGMRPNDLFATDGDFILGPFIFNPEEEDIDIQVLDYSERSRAIRGSIYDNE